MNIHQFQYILALAEHRHFEKAAEKCFISQSTLSTMISKFEDEVGIMVFDRKKKPVDITSEGMLVIEQLKKINKEIESLHEVTNELKGEVKGKLTIAVIPTIAPFLLPLKLRRLTPPETVRTLHALLPHLPVLREVLDPRFLRKLARRLKNATLVQV